MKMQLLVHYKIHTFDELDKEHYFNERNIIVICHESLPMSCFENYVNNKYYDLIFNLEKQCSGSYLLMDITIMSVEYVSQIDFME